MAFPLGDSGSYPTTSKGLTPPAPEETPSKNAQHLHQMLYIMLLSLLLVGQSTAKEISLNSQPLKYEKASVIQIGKISAKVEANKEYTLVPKTAGLLELEISPIPQKLKAGTVIGGMNLERLKLEERLLRLKREKLDTKEVIEKKMQQTSKVEQLTQKLEKNDLRLSLLDKIFEQPEVYANLLNEELSLEDLREEQAHLQKDSEEVRILLDTIKSAEYSQMEEDELRINHQLRELQFDIQKRDSYFKMPFDGTIEFIYNYDTEAPNYIDASQEIAVLRDYSQIFAHATLTDGRWRDYDETKLRLSFEGSRMNNEARYTRHYSAEKSGKTDQVYVFGFDPKQSSLLQRYVGSTQESQVVHLLPENSYLLSKYELVAADVATFQTEGWKGLLGKVEGLGIKELDFIEGAYQIAVFPAGKACVTTSTDKDKIRKPANPSRGGGFGGMRRLSK